MSLCWLAIAFVIDATAPASQPNQAAAPASTPSVDTETDIKLRALE
jgi:hypothetical protein